MKKVGLWVALLGLLALIAFRRWSSIAPPARAHGISPGDSTLVRSSPSSSEYRLPSGAVLAYLPRPSAAARAWVADQYGMNADEIISATVVWDAQPRPRSLEVGFAYNPRTLRQAIVHSLGLEDRALEFRDRTDRIEVPGDWVVRPGVASEQYLEPLEAALRVNGHPRLHIAKTHRQAVRYLVSGDAPRTGREVVIFDPLQQSPEGPLYQGSLSGFLRALGDAIGAGIDNQVTTSEQIAVTWRDNSEAYRQLGAPITPEITQATIQHVCKSLDLTIVRSDEPATVWVITEPPSQ